MKNAEAPDYGDEFSESDFDVLLEDLRIARKRSRHAVCLSLVALAINIIRLIAIVLEQLG